MPVDWLVGKFGKYGEAALANPQYPLLKNMAFYSLASLAGNFFAFIFHFYVARQLSVTDYGALAALIASFSLFSLPMGSFSALVIKKVAQDGRNAPAVAREATKLALIFSFLVGFVLVLFSGFFMSFFHLQGEWLVPIYVVLLIFSCVWAAFNGTLQGMSRFFLVGSEFAASSLIKLILAFVLVGMLGFGLIGAIGAYGSAGVVSVAIGLWFLHPMLKSNGKAYSFSGAQKEFTHIFLISAGMFLALSGDLIVLGNLFPDDSLGFYAASSTIAKVISYALLPLAAVAFPKIVETVHLKKQSNVLMFTMALLAVCGVAFLVFYHFAGAFVLSFLYSDKYLPGMQYLMVLSVATIFYCLNALLSRYFIAGKAGAYAIAAVIIPLAGLAALYAAPSISLAPYVMLGINIALFAAGMIFMRLNGVGKRAPVVPKVNKPDC